LAYHDPRVEAVPGLGLRSTPLDSAVDGADLVVIVTAHPEVDHAAVAERAALLIDFRGVTRGVRSDTVTRL